MTKHTVRPEFVEGLRESTKEWSATNRRYESTNAEGVDLSHPVETI